MDTRLRAYFGSTMTQIEVDSSLFSRAIEAGDAVVGKKTVCRAWDRASRDLSPVVRVISVSYFFVSNGRLGSPLFSLDVSPCLI
jgi:hypothetical protein